ncbi:MAG: SpoIID/LytB domain-containing protein [Candidatus Omnitrophota bacterium]|nr:SpoIID/LytB domain-containing protein [Candidatus Omnitrophota bacterium]
MVKKIAVFWLFLGLSFIYPARGIYADEAVRIAILQDSASFYLRVKGAFEIQDESGRSVYKGKNLKSRPIKADSGKIILPGAVLNLSRFRIFSKNGYIYINNRLYRGVVSIIPKDTTRFLVVNELDLEHYLRGILCNEIAPWWPLDALKAQAVVARTYALYQRQFTKNKDFDLTNDIYSQVYGGKTSEKWRSNRAVDLTKGEILTFKGNLFPAYYHAACGGHTEDASMLWKVDLAPLKGVRCVFCAASPHFKWQAEISSEEIKSKLSAKGFKMDYFDEIEIVSLNPSGRINELEIKSADNSLVISAKDFRQALGPNLIRSTNFTLKIISAKVYFAGLGWGHGVGLCQWGMHELAKSGKNYKEILEYYYPESKLTRRLLF